MERTNIVLRRIALLADGMRSNRTPMSVAQRVRLQEALEILIDLHQETEKEGEVK